MGMISISRDKGVTGKVASQYLSVAKKEFRTKNSSIVEVYLVCKSKVHSKKIELAAQRTALAFWKVTEAEEVSQLGSVDSGNKLRRQKKGLWRHVHRPG